MRLAPTHPVAPRAAAVRVDRSLCISDCLRIAMTTLKQLLRWLAVVPGALVGAVIVKAICHCPSPMGPTPGPCLVKDDFYLGGPGPGRTPQHPTWMPTNPWTGRQCRVRRSLVFM
jgi:hypothetical protein